MLHKFWHDTVVPTRTSRARVVGPESHGGTDCGTSDAFCGLGAVSVSNVHLTDPLNTSKARHSLKSPSRSTHRYLGGEVDLTSLHVIGIGPRDSNGSVDMWPVDPRTGKPVNDNVPVEHQIPRYGL